MFKPVLSVCLVVGLLASASCDSDTVPLPYSGGNEVQLSLKNNPMACDPSWAELLAFILVDGTDDGIYIESYNVCGDFATRLHNNAELAGIRAGWVSVKFEGTEIGHACNVFDTTDKGRVFIDCTGGKFRLSPIADSSGSIVSARYDYDKVAYIIVGAQYGSISIEQAESFDYQYYKQYAQLVAEYDILVAAYNNEVDVYNKEVDMYEKGIAGRAELEEPEYSYYSRWYDNLMVKNRELELRDSSLEIMLSKIGDYSWEELGIVKAIEIYW